MSRSGVVAIVPAKDEQDRLGATLTALTALEGIARVVVVDDGSRDSTALVARQAGAVVVQHRRNRGKGAAMLTGAAAVAGSQPLLFVDADLQGSALELAPLLPPVVEGQADMTIAILPPQERKGGGFGLVVGLAKDAISKQTGWQATQPLSGMRCLTREAFEAATPLAAGWGVEVGLTIDVLRSGLRAQEVPCALQHRVTGRDWRGVLHRGRQFRDVARAVAARSLTST